MSLNANYQKLEPGDEVRLLEIDGQAFGLDEVLYFHGYNVPHTSAEILAAGGDLDKLPAKSIWWQGREYKAWPCEIEGIESSTTGSDAQPTL
ncbi:phage minor tail protein L, partial [Klebsiella pneumoniae]|nr:phage minor tail protein L [Klebsiella pneumoniae]